MIDFPSQVPRRLLDYPELSSYIQSRSATASLHTILIGVMGTCEET